MARNFTISLSLFLPMIRFLLSPSFLPVSFFSIVSNFSNSLSPGIMQAFYGFSSICGPMPTVLPDFSRRLKRDFNSFPSPFTFLLVSRLPWTQEILIMPDFSKKKKKTLLYILTKTTWFWDTVTKLLAKPYVFMFNLECCYCSLGWSPIESH